MTLERGMQYSRAPLVEGHTLLLLLLPVVMVLLLLPVAGMQSQCVTPLRT